MAKYTFEDLLEWNKHEHDYNRIVGEFINAANVLENIATQYVVSNYVDTKDRAKTDEFMDAFIVRQEMTFQRIVKLFYKIYKKNHGYCQVKNKDIINEANLKNIVWLRNILAHSSFLMNTDTSQFRLHWFSSDSKLKKYNIDEHYNFSVPKQELLDTKKIIIQTNHILVMNIVSPLKDYDFSDIKKS